MIKPFIMGILIAGFVSPAAEASTLATIYAFKGGGDGSDPTGGLVLLANGSILGTTTAGGQAGLGTIFQLTPPAKGSGSWTKTTVYEFSGGDGQLPQGGLVLASSGEIFGTTLKGGSYGAGTLYRLNPPTNKSAWTETTLWNFGSGADAANPGSTLVLGPNGQVYGSAYAGGSYGAGAIFAISQDGPGGPVTEAVLWSFTGGADGAYPAALTGDSSGRLYGVATEGGTYGLGTIFSISPSGGPSPLDVLWSFAGEADGGYPTSLVPSGSDSFAGTVVVGSDRNSNGAVYSLAIKNGIASVAPVWNFAGSQDGSIPTSIVVHNNGQIFGVTAQGGDPSCLSGHVSLPCGVAFTLVPHGSRTRGWTETVMWDFSPPSAPSEPSGALLQWAPTAYLGESAAGGPGNQGTVFSLSP
jgi:uncharacterized repeat protein (TIGR03803 family)